jgi:hypothetical protein
MRKANADSDSDPDAERSMGRKIFNYHLRSTTTHCAQNKNFGTKSIIAEVWPNSTSALFGGAIGSGTQTK